MSFKILSLFLTKQLYICGEMISQQLCQLGCFWVQHRVLLIQQNVQAVGRNPPQEGLFPPKASRSGLLQS